MPAELRGFRGELAWVHALEGHAGRAYWPGGASGITLDPGVDVGHASPALVEATYRPHLTREQLAALLAAAGLRGQSARRHLAGSAVLRSIRISRAEAAELFPVVAAPYWRAVTQRFPALLADEVPGPVHTVMLSLAYNRGAGNAALGVLAGPLARRDWSAFAEAVGRMQQGHSLAGIRARRKLEAELVAELARAWEAADASGEERRRRLLAAAARLLAENPRLQALPPAPIPARPLPGAEARG